MSRVMTDWPPALRPGQASEWGDQLKGWFATVFRADRPPLIHGLRPLKALTMAQKQAMRQAITLKGSTQMVTEFFEYGVNRSVFVEPTASPPLPEADQRSILYQRGVYPSDDFRCVHIDSWPSLTSSMVKKYGLPMLLTGNESLKEYLQTVFAQVQGGSKANATPEPQNGSLPPPSPG